MGLCQSFFSEEDADTARRVVREFVRKLREKVLCGDFACNGESPEKWKVSCAHTQNLLKEVGIPYQFIKMKA